jgi:hypothetical protein
MSPGDFWWMPEVAPEGPLTLVVSRPGQRVAVYRNGLPIAVSTVSTGRPGYRTPTGSFSILQKRVEHYSTIYDNAPMPYMQRLTMGGVALHAGTLPGYPASHGCIRLPYEFARLLFGATSIGTPVVINDDAQLPRLAPLSAEERALLATGTGWWPERAPTGPVSIVVSGTDRLMILIRGGRLIGASRISLATPIAGVSAFSLVILEGGSPKWTRLILPTALSGSSDWARFEVEEEFKHHLRASLHTGATALIMADSLALSRGATTVALGGEPALRCA